MEENKVMDQEIDELATVNELEQLSQIEAIESNDSADSKIGLAVGAVVVGFAVMGVVSSYKFIKGKINERKEAKKLKEVVEEELAKAENCDDIDEDSRKYGNDQEPKNK